MLLTIRGDWRRHTKLGELQTRETTLGISARMWTVPVLTDDDAASETLLQFVAIRGRGVEATAEVVAKEFANLFGNRRRMQS